MIPLRHLAWCLAYIKVIINVAMFINLVGNTPSATITKKKKKSNFSSLMLITKATRKMWAKDSRTTFVERSPKDRRLSCRKLCWVPLEIKVRLVHDFSHWCSQHSLGTTKNKSLSSWKTLKFKLLGPHDCAFVHLYAFVLC